MKWHHKETMILLSLVLFMILIMTTHIGAYRWCHEDNVWLLDFSLIGLIMFGLAWSIALSIQLDRKEKEATQK